MNDNDKAQGTDYGHKFCAVCSIDYEGTECPSCNPKVLYHVEIGVDAGGDEFAFSDCQCGCVDFWNRKDAIAHCKEVQSMDNVARVCDSEGTEVWATD